MDVNAITYRDGDEATEREVIDLGTDNVKRLRLAPKRARAWWVSDKAQGPEWIEELTETKTVWHPVGV
jgi:hypothetical protein